MSDELNDLTRWLYAQGYDAPEPYIALYHKLRAPRLDDRIKVLCQLRKRDVLSEIISEAELAVLAERLD